MLICLREEHFKGKRVSWEHVKSMGFEKVKVKEFEPSASSPKLKISESFNQLIAKMRHGFAHNCFELIGDPITGVRIWNIPPGTENDMVNRVWDAEITEEQLCQIANLFIKYLEKTHGSELEVS